MAKHLGFYYYFRTFLYIALKAQFFLSFYISIRTDFFPHLNCLFIRSFSRFSSFYNKKNQVGRKKNPLVHLKIWHIMYSKYSTVKTRQDGCTTEWTRIKLFSPPGLVRTLHIKAVGTGGQGGTPPTDFGRNRSKPSHLKSQYIAACHPDFQTFLRPYIWQSVVTNCFDIFIILICLSVNFYVCSTEMKEQQQLVHSNGSNREIALEALGAFDLSNKGGPKGGTPADKTLSMVKGFLRIYF